jgi:hypothetical protein
MEKIFTRWIRPSQVMRGVGFASWEYVLKRWFRYDYKVHESQPSIIVTRKPMVYESLDKGLVE